MDTKTLSETLMGLFDTPTSTEDATTPIGLYADIVFDRPLDHAFTYAVPPTLIDQAAIGKRVEVPFGRGDKMTVGYLVALHHDAPQRAAKEIVRVLDDEVLLTDNLLRLTRWLADYYLCGWGQVLHAVLPAGVRDQAGTRSNTFIEAVPETEVPDCDAQLPSKQQTLLAYLRKIGAAIEQKQLLREVQVGYGPLKALLEKGLVRKFSKRIERSELTVNAAAGERAPDIGLNPDQQYVFERLQAAIRAGGYHAFLLHGVTGSGKTEVYLRAIEEVIKQGKEVIVLVPEIALTPQTIERFKGRCGEVAVLHSRLSDAERGAYWRRVHAGQVQVVVGARSAVFAPTRNLGLIVIDEEHESSFKQESTPRYHARDVAVMRARLENVPIVMGSATPALESIHNVQRGLYTRLSLPNRVCERPLPEVELVDLRHEPKQQGPYNAISVTLEREMKKALEAGGQVMLFLNRRGFSTHIHCASCGEVVNCNHCDVALTYHKHRGSLVCHFCGFAKPPVTECPACKGKAVRYLGQGTEKLETEILSKFPGRTVQRMDSDTMSRHGSHQRVLDAFRKGSIDILVGTQMIAKGLDFPNVTLVGVVNADVGLHLPDFRSAERTFQLLAQVAGRTGRGARGGKVLIQTFTPEHPCIALTVKHDYNAFAAAELALRQQHNYPPFQRLARLIIRSEKEEAAAAFADTLAGAFREAIRLIAQREPNAPKVRLLGPAEAPVFRLNDFFRFHFQVQSAGAAVLHQVLREVMVTVKVPAGVEYQLDIDPYSML